MPDGYVIASLQKNLKLFYPVGVPNFVPQVHCVLVPTQYISLLLMNKAMRVLLSTVITVALELGWYPMAVASPYM
jgi:hypothetical protein